MARGAASAAAALLVVPVAAAVPGLREYASPAARAAAEARVHHRDAPGLYTRYEFAEGLDLSTDMQVDHVWTTIPEAAATDGNAVFASSQYWAEESAGYMGSQVWRSSNGTEVRAFIFSMWDHDADHKAGWTTDDTCARFGGEGVGSHCILDYPVEEGVVYKFRVAPDGHNASGAFWTGTITDPAGKASKVGTLYYPNVGSNVGFGTFQSSSNLFLEYFVGGGCDTAVTTAVGVFGPYFHDRSTTPTMAYPSYGSGACHRSAVEGCIPMGHGCGKPRVLAQGGAGVVRNNTDQTKLW